MARYETPETIRDAYGRASKADREQIRGYIEANSVQKWGQKAFYRLLDYRNLDNGKQHIGVSAGFDPPGLTANQARALVGLPAIEGGDGEPPKKLPVKTAPKKTAPARNPLGGGGKLGGKKP